MAEHILEEKKSIPLRNLSRNINMKLVQGDLFKFIQGRVVIPHVVNNKYVAGAGFVLPLTSHFPEWKIDYLRERPKLGTSVITHSKDVCIVSMCAQTLGHKYRNLRYDALVQCMLDVAIVARLEKRDIHCPEFGSGLAGGNKDFIRELMIDIWKEFNVTVYTY
jgi:O-acetyl-ADP-ribose deacetylase (regulator of RNase III)